MAKGIKGSKSSTKRSPKKKRHRNTLVGAQLASSSSANASATSTAESDDNDEEEEIEEADEDDVFHDCSEILINDNKGLNEFFNENVIETSTRYQYHSKIIHFKRWMKDVHPETYYATRNDVDFALVQSGIIGEFLAHATKRKDAAGNYLEPMQFYSYSHVNGYVSAIYYKQLYKVNMPGLMDTECQTILKGFDRKIEKMKTDGEIPMHEGKAPLSFEAYGFLGEKSIKQSEDFSLASFAHCFLLFCWNLIARCVSVANLSFHNISWKRS